MNRLPLMIRGFASAALALVLPTQALAQETPRAGVVTTLQGTASVARTTESRPLKFKDDIFVQDRITTGEDSIVRILLGGKAVVTVRERSVLTISETATTATVEVGSGKVAVAVAKERMRAGDSVEVKTPNAVAGIRGTVLITEVSQDSASGASTQFTLLTGIVDVSGLDVSTRRASGARVTLQPLQTLGVAGFTRPGAPRNISRADAQAVAAAYKVSVPTPPTAANAPMVERQVEQGVAAAAALVPLDPKAAKVDPKASVDGPGQDGAADEDKGARDRKGAGPGNSWAGGRETPAPAPTSGPAPTTGPAPSTPAPTVPVAGAPAPAPVAPVAPIASAPVPAPVLPTTPVVPTVNPPAVPPVATLPGLDKKIPKVTDLLPKKVPPVQPRPR
jgi:hypothetical protein